MRREFVTAEIETGRIKGTRDQLGLAFKGIPYAGPVAGAGRLKAPPPLEAWPGVLDCTEFGPQAPQRSSDLTLMGSALVTSLLFDPPEWQVSDENCLNLNVWTPALDHARRPVMVWLHSGGFFFGTASTHKCDGARLSANGDVVVVTINHRLGLLGFLHLEDLCGSEYRHSGNAGLLDLVEALRWIRRDIAAFGGDPDNVTVFGESGGGGKVNSLRASPAAQGLFHKAIVQSGAWLRFWTRDKANELAAGFLSDLGILATEIDRLREVSLAAFQDAQTKAMKRLLEVPIPRDGAQTDRAFGPVADGDFLPGQPTHPHVLGLSRDVPLLIGSNEDEGTFMLSGDPDAATLDEAGLLQRCSAFFGADSERLLGKLRHLYPDLTPAQLYGRIATDMLLRMPTVESAELKHGAGGAPVFVYEFGYRTSVMEGRLGATHGVEIPFVFDMVDIYPLAGQSPDRHEFAERVRDSWVAFARGGRPSHSRLPEWPAYEPASRQTMHLDIVSEVRPDPHGDARQMWAAYRGAGGEP